MRAATHRRGRLHQLCVRPCFFALTPFRARDSVQARLEANPGVRLAGQVPGSPWLLGRFAPAFPASVVQDGADCCRNGDDGGCSQQHEDNDDGSRHSLSTFCFNFIAPEPARSPANIFPLDGTGLRAYSGLPLRWGVIRMGNRLRLLKAALVRALLLPALLALAWVIWGAASAGAATGDTGTSVPLSENSLSTASVATLAKSAVHAPLASVVTQVVPATRLLPAIPALPAPAGPTAAVTKPVPAVVSTVAETAGSVLNGASTAVSTVTTTVATTAAPVLGTADNLVETAQDIIASVPKLPLPAVPVPAVPVPSLPALPVPSVPAPPATAPGPPVHVPELPAVPVPGVTPTTPGPGNVGKQPVPAVPQQAVSTSAVRAAPGSAKSAAGAVPVFAAGTILPAVQDTVAGLPLAGTGLSLAELQMTTPERPEPAGASPSANEVKVHVLPGDGQLEPLALSEGTSGNSPGSEGSGAQAAEATGDWDRTPLLAGPLMCDAAQHLPTSPAFDPGCSPD